MKIDTKKTLKDLSGVTIKSGDNDFTIGEALSEIMVMDEGTGKMKSYVLANKLHNDKSVEVDSADLAIIKKAVESTKRYNSLISGQILVMLEEIKESK